MHMHPAAAERAGVKTTPVVDIKSSVPTTYGFPTPPAPTTTAGMQISSPPSERGFRAHLVAAHNFYVIIRC